MCILAPQRKLLTATVDPRRLERIMVVYSLFIRAFSLVPFATPQHDGFRVGWEVRERQQLLPKHREGG